MHAVAFGDAIAFEVSILLGKRAAWAVLYAFVAICAAAQVPSAQMHGQVNDEDGKPVDAVGDPTCRQLRALPCSLFSDATGHFEISGDSCGARPSSASASPASFKLPNILSIFPRA